MKDTKCYCISLKEATDDRVLADKEFKKHHLNVEYHLVERSPLGGMHGCFQSHIDVLKKGLETNAKYIMVMEDDVYFDIHDTTIFQKINKFIKTLDGIWCFCFGYLTPASSQKVNHNFNVLKSCQCTHAYLVPRQTAKQLITMEWKNIGVDCQWIEKIDQFYVPNKMIAFQRNHISSISSSIRSQLFNMIGFKNIARLSENWSQNDGYILFFGFLIILILILIVINYYQYEI